MNKLIYLDNSATTQLDGRVLECMIPYLKAYYGNASSNHSFGTQIKNAIDKARVEVSDLLKCESKEIVFTSGATESLNIAIKGIALASDGTRSKIITIVTEHKAVLDNFQYLEEIGFDIVYLEVNSFGQIDLEKLENTIDKNTIAVCAMLVNNETGVFHPIKEIADISHKNGAFLICDATQAIGKIPVNVFEIGADMLTFSAHKFHGPKGVGGLFVKKGVKLSTLIHGGGQENGLRSGTMNVPGIIGLAKACQIASDDMAKDHVYILSLRNRLEKALLDIKGAHLNGHPENRCYHISNISFPDLDANILIRETTNLAVSNGSACTSAVFEPSHVLMAMGADRTAAYGALRFSFSKFNTIEEIDETAYIIKKWIKDTNQQH